MLWPSLLLAAPAWALDEPIIPPAGLYYVAEWLNYRVDHYRMAPDNAKLPGDNQGRVQGLTNRLLWVSPYRILGADYAAEALVPAVHSSLNFSLANYHESNSGWGDIYLSPLILGWHGERWDAVAGTGLWLDNGRTRRFDDPGVGYKRLVLSGGVNYYLNEPRTLSTSALLRFERGGTNTYGVRKGHKLYLDWTAYQRWGPLQAGLGGYSQWQLSDDTGAGATPGRYQRHAIGGQVNYLFLQSKSLLKLGLYREFDVHAGGSLQTQGFMLRLAWAKAL